MAGIRSGENRELYEAFGLDYLLDTEPAAEDPLFRAGTSSYLRSADGLVKFFGDEERDFPGSPAEGYGDLASGLADQLEELIKVSTDVGDNKTPQFEAAVRLRSYPQTPESVGVSQRYKASHDGRRIPGNRIYETEETPASRAFRGAMDALLMLREPRSINSEDGKTADVYRGRYLKAHPTDGRKTKQGYLELVETRGSDEVGSYREVILRIPRPKELTTGIEDQEKPSQPFETTNEREERRRRRSARWLGKWNDILDSILGLTEEEDRKRALEALEERAKSDTNIQPVDASTMLKRLLDNK